MKHIDKVFKEKLYNQKAAVPDGMWEKIAPALEEKSGRSILWFWFAGILTLIIAGIAYLLFTNYQDANSSDSTLAMETPLQEIQTSNPISETLVLSGDLKDPSTTDQLRSNKTQIDKTTVESPKLKKNNSAQQKINTKVIVKKTLATTSTDSNINNTTSNSEVNTDNLYGKPANLVITKSYLSDNGSIIEKSDLSKDTKNAEPSYNVFINSEGLNAGALLRIIEPLENIPLPAFSIDLKKKIIL